MSTRELTEDHRPLADSELDVVTGGTYEPAAAEMGDLKFSISAFEVRDLLHHSHPR